MSIAIDQTRLRRITCELLPGESLDRVEAVVILELVRMASGADRRADPQEHVILQAVTQRVGSLAGLELDKSTELPAMLEGQSRQELLVQCLSTTGARELAYALALLVSVADLELVPAESANLEELQHALDIDDRRATDLTVFVVETVAAAA